MGLKLKRVGKVWWITGFDDPADDCGPYATRGEAEEDRAGLERTRRYGHERRFWTVEKRHSGFGIRHSGKTNSNRKGAKARR
jgi:hypothetical protein